MRNNFFNPAISTNLINNPVILFPSGVFKIPNILYSYAHFHSYYDWTVYDLTEHFDLNLHWVVAYFINYKVCAMIDLEIVTLKV